MSRAFVQPGALSGVAAVPESKSAAHRALLCAGLARGESVLAPLGESADIRATERVLKALGARLSPGVGKALRVKGPLKAPPGSCDLFCGESGSTLRFLIPIAAALGASAVFSGEGRLPKRPLETYLDLLPSHGVSCESKGGLPLSISGHLTPGTFALPGDISSQFITGLLFALPLLKADSDIILTTPLQSAGYVEMTRAIQKAFGVESEPAARGFHVPGRQQYTPRAYEIEGDWSQAAFFLCAGAILQNGVAVSNLQKDSTQGDRAIFPILQKFGAAVSWEDGLCVSRPGALSAMEIDVGQIPDLLPILAVTAAYANGRTHLKNAARVRLKESDRVHAMCEGLRALGIDAEEEPDGLWITGGPLHGGAVNGYNDHRIVMAFAVAALGASGPVTISDAQAIDKSWPAFFDDYNALGGNAHVILGQ